MFDFRFNTPTPFLIILQVYSNFYKVYSTCHNTIHQDQIEFKYHQQSFESVKKSDVNSNWLFALDLSPTSRSNTMYFCNPVLTSAYLNRTIKPGKALFYKNYEKMKLFFLFLIFMPLFLIYGQEEAELHQLIETLFANYDNRIRPYVANGTPTMIQMEITDGILINLVSGSQTVGINMGQYLVWNDRRLVWDPQDHNNITEIYVPFSIVWNPKIFFYNSVDINNLTPDPDAHIASDGTITVYLFYYISSMSNIIMDRFPFDTQYVFIGQSSALYHIADMDLTIVEPSMDGQSYFYGNAEFDLVNITPRYWRFEERNKTGFALDYVFQLKRRSTYYTTVIVIPVFLSMIICVVGVLLPGTTAGENIGIVIATFFALMLLLGIVADDMPKSNSMSIIGVYILVMIILCACSILVSILIRIILTILIITNSNPPKFLRKLFLVREKGHKKKGEKTLDENNVICKKSHDENNNQPSTMEEEIWNDIFDRFRFFLIFLFQLSNVVNLLVYYSYSWMPPDPMPASLL